MAADEGSTTPTPSRAGQPHAISAFSPRLVSLNVEVNRTLEPALGRIDAVCDNMRQLSQILTTLQNQQQQTQKQLDDTEAGPKTSDLFEIRGRLAALDQGILNLQIHFQDFIDSHTQLQVLCKQNQTRIEELYTMMAHIQSNLPAAPPTDSLVSGLPWIVWIRRHQFEKRRLLKWPLWKTSKDRL